MYCPHWFGSIDICTFLGTSDLRDPELSKQFADKNIKEKCIESDDRYCRIYFSVDRYPPPENINEGGTSETFARLRHQIRYECNKAGSPVYCNGDGSNQNEITFVICGVRI